MKQGSCSERFSPACQTFASHVMNAFNEGTKIHFDTPEAKNNMFPFFPDIHGAPFNGPESASRLTRWTVDMDSNSGEFEKRERLTDFVGEFPRIDERYATEPYRHGWLLGMGEGPGSRASIGHVDIATGKAKVWQAGPGRTLQEPCFIPKSKDAPEGEGYVVQIQPHNDDGQSDLLLFDAQRVDEGPMATIHIPFRMRFGLHGNWVPGSELAVAKSAVN